MAFLLFDKVQVLLYDGEERFFMRAYMGNVDEKGE